MAKKRVYGEGTVTKRKDGRFQISVPGSDGKRRYTYADKAGAMRGMVKYTAYHKNVLLTQFLSLFTEYSESFVYG